MSDDAAPAAEPAPVDISVTISGPQGGDPDRERSSPDVGCHIRLGISVIPSMKARSRRRPPYPEEPDMSAAIRSLVIPVSDLDATKTVYSALLGEPHTDQPYYVGYNVDGFEVSLAPGDAADGPVAYVDVEDLDATRDTLLAAGATERSAPRQVAPEARVCVLADADGNPIGLRGR